MARLIYSALASLDGYVADEQGDFSWAEPDEEVHLFVNELTRPIGAHLLGRRMYETLVAWENPEAIADDTPATREFAELWKATDKVVYSRTLDWPSSARTRIEREFDTASVAEMKAYQDLSVAGPELAARAFEAGLVDEIHLFLAPVLVGGGKPALPESVQLDLELQDERRFERGFVYLRYLTRS